MSRPQPPSPYKKGFSYPGGDNFRSPMPPPRFQSSPRYFSSSGSGQSPRFVGAPGNAGFHNAPHNRSPRNRSPRGEFESYSVPFYSEGSSPYHDRVGNSSGSPCYPGPSYNYNKGPRPNGNGHSHRGRYHSGNRGYSTNRGNDSDCNPGSCSDISPYYSPKMVQDPWSHLTPRLATNIHSS